MSTRKASIKETGEELSQEEWARFDAAVAKVQAERPRAERPSGEFPRRDRRGVELADVADATRTDLSPRR